jgi:pimeloyl-ACP methyl ester carboxylesterase
LLADLVNLLNHLELDRVRLISHDIGCLSGFALCLDHPKRVERHVALGVPPPPLMRFNVRLLPPRNSCGIKEVLAVPGLGTRLISDKHQRVPRHMFSRFMYDRASLSAEDMDVFIPRFVTLIVPGCLGAIPASGPAALRHRRPRISYRPGELPLRDHEALTDHVESHSSTAPLTSSPMRGRMR